MSAIAKKKYELWKESDGYSFFPEDSDSARNLLRKDAKLVWTVEANSWEEAQSRKHEYLGWDPYKPMK
jgi:hypothetical protein